MRNAAAMVRAGAGRVRVCIVYEHALFARGIEDLLRQEKALRMVGLLERPHTSLGELKRLRPDVVVVEGDGGLAFLESVEDAMGVVISLRGDQAMILTGQPIRVSGPEELARAIRAVARRRRRTRVRRTPA